VYPKTQPYPIIPPRGCKLRTEYIEATSRAFRFSRKHEIEYNDKGFIRQVYMRCWDSGIDPERTISLAKKIGWSQVYQQIVVRGEEP
jgi:hypothetical protein